MTNEEWEIIGQFAKDIVDRFNDQEKRIKNLEKQIEILSELKQFSYLLDMDGMRDSN
jgi:hypothetical protein